MSRPTAQRCDWCGRDFVGSDCLGKPCHDCRDRFGLDVKGVSRDADNPRAVVVYLDRAPTDGELRELHQNFKFAVSIVEPGKPYEIAVSGRAKT